MSMPRSAAVVVDETGAPRRRRLRPSFSRTCLLLGSTKVLSETGGSAWSRADFNSAPVLVKCCKTKDAVPSDLATVSSTK
eukprot:2082439-Pyramimonas_sp.AAC.1